MVWLGILSQEPARFEVFSLIFHTVNGVLFFPVRRLRRYRFSAGFPPFFHLCAATALPRSGVVARC